MNATYERFHAPVKRGPGGRIEHLICRGCGGPIDGADVAGRCGGCVDRRVEERQAERGEQIPPGHLEDAAFSSERASVMSARHTIPQSDASAPSPFGWLRHDLFTPLPTDVVRVPAITICQPHVALICLPADHAEAKRVENRKWRTRFRGRILIHAGKSRAWLSEPGERKWERDWSLLPSMPFGAAVGAADLVACVEMDAAGRGRVPKGLRWVATHKHAWGPWCFVLANIQLMSEPLPMRGQQKIFNAELPRQLALEMGFR